MIEIGSARILKIPEMDLNGMTLAQLMPAMGGYIPDQHPSWIPGGTADPDGHALLSIHSWLVFFQDQTILIDTGAGNGKSRPQQPVLDHLDNPFLERLAEAGVRPEDVDFILHTHIHSDHVGWNTRLIDGEWRPTFPNATVICSRLEWDYGAALADGDEPAISAARAEAGLGSPVRVPVSGTFNDSMRPLWPSGRVRLIEIGEDDVLPGIRFVKTPGHSIDHAAIELTSECDTAIFGGDVMHHPLELYAPELVSSFCEFPEAARRSRVSLLKRAADNGATYFSAHFPLSSVGRIARDGDGFTWSFLDA